MDFITLKDLRKTYGNAQKSVHVLRGINLTVKKGETVAVLGASGVGKSTMLNIIGALDRASSGDVFYENETLSRLDDKRLAAFRNRFIGFVFQFHHLLPEFTALENVMLPALIGGVEAGAARSRARELLGEVGLAQRLKHKPGELSGGEQQRTAIVRAIIQEPQLILADEPTGNLDTRTADDVFELLMSLNKKKNTTMIIVTHNERLAAKMSRRIKMVDGCIVE